MLTSPGACFSALRCLLQALAARRERRAAELSDMFRLLGEVEGLASSIERNTRDTHNMMKVGYNM